MTIEPNPALTQAVQSEIRFNQFAAIEAVLERNLNAKVRSDSHKSEIVNPLKRSTMNFYA